jgi:hypothetical protein
MSESAHHRSLVLALASEIFGDSIWVNKPIIYCDIQDGCLSNFPPIIGNNRPDVFARDIATSLSIIGEAKTADDIDKRHTFAQLASFFDYLRDQPHSELWMGVPWLCAGMAMRVSVDIRKKLNAENIPIRVVAFMIGNISQRRTWRV